jgi:hypothetical protein|tara:strand:- start:14860 stop:15153 length:294 start_codon:yes stop_codon:yes gene_type:complete
VVLQKNVADAIIMNMHVFVIKKLTPGGAINVNLIHVCAMITLVTLDQYVMQIRVILVITVAMVVKKNVKVLKIIMNIIVVLLKNITVVPQKKLIRIM